MIDLTIDSISEEGSGTHDALLVFYGADTYDKIQYQDQNLGRQRKYPSRKNGLGFDTARLRREKNWVCPVRTLQDVQPTWDKDMYMKSPPLCFDEAVRRNWAQDSFSECLLYGFPLLEDVVFYRPRNYTGAASACFMKAVAYLVYGHHSFYLRVQAEHLQHFGDVLEWEDHPRHREYTRLNEDFHSATIQTGQVYVETRANYFQLLSIPQIWMPLNMFDVTADLYNLFIVVYAIRKSGAGEDGSFIVTDIKTMGSYNARHVFLLFTGDHFQPMVPNDFLASEFTFPRITYENVKSFPNSDNSDQGKSSVDLRWRKDGLRIIDRSEGALPVDHVFYRETLRTTMTGSYEQQS